MMRGLAPKLTVGLFLFVLVLGVSTAVLVYIGFDRGQQTAGDRSREGLELQGRERLGASTRFESAALQAQFRPVREFAEQSADYMYNLKAARGEIPWSPANLVAILDGIYWDETPGRVTDVLVLGESDAAELDAIRASAALDALFPTLDNPGQSNSAGFRPIAAFFMTEKLSTRYYPPLGTLKNVDPETDATGLFAALGPASNPEQRSIWTPPYEDSGGRGLVVTAYTPVYEGTVLRGAIGIDLSIDTLITQVERVRGTESSFAIYMDRTGVLLDTAGSRLISSELVGRENAAMTTLLAEMEAGKSGIARVDLGGRAYFFSYMPFEEIGGSFAQAAPVDELTAQAATIEGSIRDQGDQTVMVMLAMMSALFLCGLVTSLWLVRRYVFHPIADLERGTRRIAAGDYESLIPVRTDDELGNLAVSFNTMAAEVRLRSTQLEARVLDRTRSLEELVVQRDQRVRELEATASIASSLTLQHPLELTLAAVAEQVRSATAVEACAIASFGDAPANLIQAAGTAGIPGEGSRGFAAAIAAAGRACLATRAGDVPEFSSDEIGQPDGSAPVEVPIVYRGRQAGVLLAWYPAGHEPQPEETSFIEAIADQVAVAIENAQLLAAASESAALEERQRLARELHDSVSQAIYGIGLGARTARRRLGPDAAPSIVEPVDFVLSLADTALAEMRALIFELRPDALEQEGLVAALERQLAAIEARYGIPVERTLNADPPVPLSTKEALYRISQEGVQNAVRHARPSKVTVTLETIAGFVRLEIRDDGSGFDPQGNFPGHLGLRSMEERATKSGGTWRIESEIDGGTRIEVMVPIAP